MQIDMKVLTVSADRNAAGETQSELVTFGSEGDAFLWLRINNKDDFAKLCPDQAWTLTIEPAADTDAAMAISGKFNVAV